MKKSAAIRIAEKDLRTEFRRIYEILSIITFSVSSVLLFSFAWGGAITTSPEVVSAALWMVLFFTSILTFTTSFTREMDRGTLGGLKTLPCSSFSILLGKTLYAAVLLLLIEAVLLPFSIVFLNLKLPANVLDFLAIFILGGIDLALAGSFISGLVMFSEGKTLLLSFLLFPVCLPVLISSVNATNKIIGGFARMDVLPELTLLFAFLFSIIAVENLTFKFVLEE